jgi:hypothetical protein
MYASGFNFEQATLPGQTHKIEFYAAFFGDQLHLQ